MKSMLLLVLYLSDQLLSKMLPFSSGLFALALVFICMNDVVLYRRGLTEILIFVLAELFLGVSGALFSATPVSLFFFANVALFSVLWIIGMGMCGGNSILIGAHKAFIGVVVASGFLFFSILGWDAMSLVQGVPTNRGAGLFIEPSHYALFVSPLWLIAFQEHKYRIPLFAFLIFAVLSCFSATLLVMVLLAILVKAYIALSRVGISKICYEKFYFVGSCLVISAIFFANFIQIENDTLSSYVESRVNGIFSPEGDDTNNLSSLVVLQGFELAQLSFMESMGLGVGLGNFGLSARVVDNSAYRTKVNNITIGVDQNLREGGLLANKLVGELGILALGIPLLLVRYFRNLKSGYDASYLTYHCAFAVALICLVFVRGISYFSAPACLSILSLAGLLSIRNGLSSCRYANKRLTDGSSRCRARAGQDAGFNS